jgi:hypothetical protein
MESDQLQRFVRALAEYLVSDQARKSIELEMGLPAAMAWAKLRNATPLFGYPTVEEAEKQLAEWLRIPPPAKATRKRNRSAATA